MRVFITTLLLLSSSYAFSQNKYLPTSSAHTQIVSEKLEGVFIKIHRAYKAGEIKVYLNDSLKTEMLPEYYTNYFGQIDESKLYEGLKATCRFNNITSAKQQREITCIAPLYNLIVDGFDMGVFAMYFVKIDDVKKVLDKETFKLVLALFSLAEKTVHNTPHKSVSLLNSRGNLSRVVDSIPTSVKLFDWVYGSVEVDLIESELSEIYDATKACMANELERALLQNSTAYKVYEDTELTQRIEQLNAHKPFMRNEVIVVPDAKHPGEFQDSTVYIGPSFYNIVAIKHLGKSVQIQFDENTIYLRKKDSECIV
ncbi:MAG: hypothetical protein KDC92_11150, partial [Bacteroidetes bacterium]|nr:hypothetical protein [Bacteroidota bacterium]